jgi:hypothetical protein
VKDRIGLDSIGRERARIRNGMKRREVRYGVEDRREEQKENKRVGYVGKRIGKTEGKRVRKVVKRV